MAGELLEIRTERPPIADRNLDLAGNGKVHSLRLLILPLESSGLERCRVEQYQQGTRPDDPIEESDRLALGQLAPEEDRRFVGALGAVIGELDQHRSICDVARRLAHSS